MWSLVNSVVAIKVHAGCCCYGNRHPFWCRSNRLGRHPKKHLHDRQLHEKPNKISIKRSTCKIFKPYSWSIEGWSNHNIDVHTSHVYRLDQIPEKNPSRCPWHLNLKTVCWNLGTSKFASKRRINRFGRHNMKSIDIPNLPLKRTFWNTKQNRITKENYHKS